jgi:hypothetical protein
MGRDSGPAYGHDGPSRWHLTAARGPLPGGSKAKLGVPMRKVPSPSSHNSNLLRCLGAIWRCKNEESDQLALMNTYRQTIATGTSLSRGRHVVALVLKRDGSAAWIADDYERTSGVSSRLRYHSLCLACSLPWLIPHCAGPKPGWLCSVLRAACSRPDRAGPRIVFCDGSAVRRHRGLRSPEERRGEAEGFKAGAERSGLSAPAC